MSDTNAGPYRVAEGARLRVLGPGVVEWYEPGCETWVRHLNAAYAAGTASSADVLREVREALQKIDSFRCHPGSMPTAWAMRELAVAALAKLPKTEAPPASSPRA